MSYLDVPRLHFSGEFFADPSTLNNTVANHSITGAMPGPSGWSPNGRHHFQLRGCVVQSAVDASGTVLSAPAQDKLIQGTVESTDGTGVARLVDLDPEYQFGSQIWGLEIRVRDSASQGFTAVLETATLRELWMARAPGGFSAGIGGTYQSVLTPVTWTPASGPMQSPLLQALRGASPNRLSIRLVCWRYESAAGPTFGFGQLVGTIGPSAAAEPARFIADRRLVHAGAGTFGVASVNSAAFNTAPFKVDGSRRRLVIDLGNALPEQANGDRRAIGPLRAEIVNTGANPPTVLGAGPIPNATADFRRNAGVEEIALTAAQVTALATRPLRIKAGPDLVLAERPNGIHVDVSDTVVRLNPGETKDIEIVASQMGRPMANANVHIERTLTRPQALTAISVRTGAPAFSTTLTLPGVVTTNSSGRVVLRLVAGDPAHPRPDVDGQVSFLGFYVGASATAATQRGEIAIRVFDRQPMPAVTPPTFVHVRPILEQYFRLYPAMQRPTASKPFGFVDLNDLAQVRPVAPVLAASLRRAETAGNYMPVTRDLSRDKKALLLAWLDAGAPA